MAQLQCDYILIQEAVNSRQVLEVCRPHLAKIILTDSLTLVSFLLVSVSPFVLTTAIYLSTTFLTTRCCLFSNAACCRLPSIFVLQRERTAHQEIPAREGPQWCRFKWVVIWSFERQLSDLGCPMETPSFSACRLCSMLECGLSFFCGVSPFII